LKRLGKIAIPLMFLLLFALGTGHALAQGCTQCRDNTAATPPATRQAYRRAIALMTLTAGGIFLAGVVLVRRNP